MAEGGSQGLGDLFSIIGGNPIAAITKNIDNFRKGVDGFLTAVHNFNRTMETLDTIANRVTRLMDDIEEPVRLLLPQVTKATKQSLEMFERASEPLDRVIPGLERLAGTLSSPALTRLPMSLDEFLETMGDVAARLRPLSQLAEAAGNMFGMRGLSALRLPGLSSTGGSGAASSSAGSHGAHAAPARSSATPTPAAHTTTPKKGASKKAAAKPAAQRATAKQPAAKKSSAKKNSAKKAAARK